MTPADYMAAARVPANLEPQRFGLWTIERRGAGETILHELGRDLGLPYGQVGWPDYTLLRRITDASLHLEAIGGEVVMEDSLRELRKHLPIWLAARGRVLKTGLGLGCVVRGLLANPAVDHIDVVEIDAGIIRVIGAEFAGNPRVTIHHADALTWEFGDRRWEFAWHDLHSFGEEHLDCMHMELIHRFMNVARHQGAWNFPRMISRLLPFQLVGTPRQRRRWWPSCGAPAATV